MIDKAPWRGNDLLDWVRPRSPLDLTPATGWRPNEPFRATLVLTGTERGRSAARFVWRNTETKGRMIMFMTDMVDLVQNAEIKNGYVTGHWRVVKRGQNYGIARADVTE